MTKLQAEDGSFLFPFVGAGDATYFEWAEVHVLFERQPSETEKQVIAARVPPPLRDSIDWEGPQLMVASDQFAHMHIAEAYPAGATDAEQEEEDDEDDEEDDDEDDEYGGRFFFAKSSQVHKFNEDIQEWLAHAHQTCPVRVAFRHEDLESGGTELSPWHDWSIKQVPRLLPHFEKVLESNDDTHAAYMVGGILGMASEAAVEIPARFREWLEPGKKELAAVQDGDAQALLELLGKHEKIREVTLETLADDIDRDDAKQLRALFAAAELLLRQQELPEELVAALAVAAAAAEHADDASPEDRARAERALAQIRQRAHDDAEVGNQLAYAGYSLTQSKRWKEAIELFEQIVDAPSLEKTAYNNALYVIMADNNKMPVVPERHRRFLAAALPHGPENPSIFYNAACVYYELGEVEKVFEHIKLALEHGYSKPQQIQSEPLFAPIAGDPRFVALFEGFKKERSKKAKQTKPADDAKKPAKAKKPVKGKEAAGRKKPAKAKKPVKVKRPTNTKKPAKTKKPARNIKNAKSKKPAKAKKPAGGKKAKKR